MENRRKNYFIKREFQTKFILKFCALVALTAFISAAVVYLFLSQSVTTVFENSKIVIKPSTEFIIPGLVLSSLISILLVSIATIVTILFISHRIAGPLYKVENSLERLGEGDVSFDIYFRRDDEAKVLSEVFNKSRQGINRMISDIKREVKKLAVDIDDLKRIGVNLPSGAKDIKKSADNLENSKNILNEKIERFRLG